MAKIAWDARLDGSIGLTAVWLGRLLLDAILNFRVKIAAARCVRWRGSHTHRPARRRAYASGTNSGRYPGRGVGTVFVAASNLIFQGDWELLLPSHGCILRGLSKPFCEFSARATPAVQLCVPPWSTCGGHKPTDRGYRGLSGH